MGAFADVDYRYLDEGAVGRSKPRTICTYIWLSTRMVSSMTGRQKELIIRGGVNISPVEIDSILMQRPEVIEAATVGVPDDIYGEEVVAYVVLRAGSGLGADDILRHCNAALPAFKAPKKIVLTDALPKTERGKLDRKALVERWTSKVES
jgi:long-chain acyl-CoA synthetase